MSVEPAGSRPSPRSDSGQRLPRGAAPVPDIGVLVELRRRLGLAFVTVERAEKAEKAE